MRKFLAWFDSWFSPVAITPVPEQPAGDSEDVELRAQRALRLLTDPLLRDVLHRMRYEVFASWQAARTTQERERTWDGFQAIGLFEATLRRYLDEMRFQDKKQAQAEAYRRANDFSGALRDVRRGIGTV